VVRQPPGARPGPGVAVGVAGFARVVRGWVGLGRGPLGQVDLPDALAVGVSRVDVIFGPDDNLYFFYPTDDGFRYFTSRATDGWQRWSGPLRLTGPEWTGRDASKHDRRRWREKGILSFTAKVVPQGFAVVDVELAHSH
jgi:hypothetical protein